MLRKDVIFKCATQFVLASSSWGASGASSSASLSAAVVELLTTAQQTQLAL
jgi:hypothetical protein